MYDIPLIRITFKEACRVLSVSRDSLYKLIESDSSFPRPIKEGETRQSPVYFDYPSLVKWWNNKNNIAGQSYNSSSITSNITNTSI